MLCSIIVLAHGKRHMTERCLETLEEALGDELGRSFELVLVDNASPDDTAELFAEWSDRAVVLVLPENRNFAGGCNAGARAASGDVLLFLNNDTEVPAGTLEVVADQAREPGVGAVGTRLIYPDGTIQHAGVAHREWQPDLVLPLHLFHHEPGDMPLARAVYDLDAVTGACLAMPRAVFDELDGFDEVYANGLEDIDLCLRVRTAGHRVVYRGDVHLVHHERITRGAGHDERRNQAIFTKRWAAALADDGEALRRHFDNWFGPPIVARYFGDHVEGASLTMAGRLRSSAPEAAEARALLSALIDADVPTAARDWQPTWESPRSSGPEWTTLLEAEKLPARNGAATIRVAAGTLWSLPAGAAAIARLATLPGPRSRLDVDAVWAATPALIDELAAHGFPREALFWLPPAIPDVATGPGGQGVLALLPAHDHDACRVLLTALGAAATGTRLLPSVRGPIVERLVAEILPDAALLDPIADERRFAELAAASDVVCGCDGDPFERRLLVAAASGAATVTHAGGPVASVLRDAATVADWTDVDALRGAIDGALGSSAARARRAEAVRRECGDRERLRELAA